MGRVSTARFFTLSAMQITSNLIGDKEYSDKLKAFLAETGKELSTGLRQEARLMAVSLATQTQPFGTGSEGQGKGQAAVERDVSRLFATPSTAYSAILGKDGPKLAREFYVLTSQGKPSDAQHLLSERSSSAMAGLPIGTKVNPDIHSAYGPGKGTGRRTAKQIVIDAKSRERFIKQKQRLVGFAKSGWASCARSLGGTRGIPGWVSRNKGPGSVVDNSRAAINPTIILRNEVGYIDKVLTPAGIANAYQIGRRRVEKMMEIALRKAKAKVRLK